MVSLTDKPTSTSSAKRAAQIGAVVGRTAAGHRGHEAEAAPGQEVEGSREIALAQVGEAERAAMGCAQPCGLAGDVARGGLHGSRQRIEERG